MASAPGPIYDIRPLHAAARADSEARVRSLLDGGANLEELDMTGDTPLHTAAMNASATIVALLLNAGANINARNVDGYTPLHYAVERTENAKLLLERGADIEAKDDFQRTALDLAFEMAVQLANPVRVQAAINTSALLIVHGANLTNATAARFDTNDQRAALATAVRSALEDPALASRSDAIRASLAPYGIMIGGRRASRRSAYRKRKAAHSRRAKRNHRRQ